MRFYSELFLVCYTIFYRKILYAHEFVLLCSCPKARDCSFNTANYHAYDFEQLTIYIVHMVM